MHINNQKLSFDIFTVGHLLISSWNMILISNDFWHKRKIYILTHTVYCLVIATNIPVLLLLCSRVTLSINNIAVVLSPIRTGLVF